MSYRGKIPYQYDKAGKSWREGAAKNWPRYSGASREALERNDRRLLAERPTRYHRFTEPQWFTGKQMQANPFNPEA